MEIGYQWRGFFENEEVNRLHAEAFETRFYDESEWNWRTMVERHSLGWVTARDGGVLVGFLNVLWDGLVHAWLQDAMVASANQRHGIGTALIRTARDEAREAGCEYLHVDFEDDMARFYVGSCGFRPVSAGLIELKSP